MSNYLRNSLKRHVNRRINRAIQRQVNQGVDSVLNQVFSTPRRGYGYRQRMPSANLSMYPFLPMGHPSSPSQRMTGAMPPSTNPSIYPPCSAFDEPYTEHSPDELAQFVQMGQDE